MRFSLFSLLDVYDTEARTSVAIYQQTLEQIALADELGFDSYWIGEHHGYLTPNQLLANPNPAILLAAAAKLTQRIGLNTAVANLSLRHPLQLAEDYALVDLLSQGRLGLGIGRGSFAHEYAAFGQDVAESFGRFEESWEIIQRLWRGEQVTFQGRYFQLENAKLNVTPVQQPFPRHWFSAIKGDSFATRGRATQPVISLPHISAKSFADAQKLVENHRSHYLAAGGDNEHYELPLILYTFVAPTRSEALHVAVDALRRYMEHQHPGSHEQIMHVIHHLMDQKLLWFGTPSDLIEVIAQFQAHIDPRHVVFWSDFGGLPPELVTRSMWLIAQEVLPHFTGQTN
ncbi:LLM class flavin-dependent oxidoreductase [Ktedonobacter racemifer]|uniref:Luciferase-like, subgroup n=1 Tax=Ktedonobacter racemifer DSM 44963 TaxID=485913 RepID=D6TU16_KTERA|nr:LLM class flavin-dependent oxidoreductase [Ktedonobacter racemifer]EFH83917.1 Luciferase-like, subgroup [Ktedonobacter racemifer DSM 44963]